MLRTWQITCAAFVLAAGLAACSDNGKNEADAAANEDASSDVAPTADAGGDLGTPSVALDPPPAGHGIQIKMVSTIEPTLDVERCMFVRVPAEGLNVVRQEVRFTAGSHHVLLHTTPYSEIPTKTLGGKTIDTSGVFDCSENGPSGDWDITGIVGGSQKPNGTPPIDRLPEGTAVRIPGGTILLVNTHYLNASQQPLETTAYINLYTIPDNQVTQEAGILFMHHLFIRVSGKSAAGHGEGVARMRCPISQDITLLGVQSHMHRRGVDYKATRQVINSMPPPTGRTLIPPS
jgi:hypothetical protein